MKRITTLLLGMAVAVMFVVPAHSAVRTFKKETVKTEVSFKIVKNEIVIVNQVIPAAVQAPFDFSQKTNLNFLAADKPPGFTGFSLTLINYENCVVANRICKKLPLCSNYKPGLWQSRT